MIPYWGASPENTAITVPSHFLQTPESTLSSFSENAKTSQGLVFS
jgi:hypothetical protein